MAKFTFLESELETINNFKKLMHYDDLVAVLKGDDVIEGSFKGLNDYLCELNDLVEFKPSFSHKEGMLKFNDDQRLIQISTFEVLHQRIKKMYGDRINPSSDLATFYVKTKGIIDSSDNKSDTIFVDLDGCFGYRPKLDAHPSFVFGEREIKSKIVEMIFSKCFKYDDQNEWSRVACEHLLRYELNIPDSECDHRLSKLTDFKRYGVETDNSYLTILYNDMIEKRKDKYGVEYWRIYLPKYKDYEKAWINVKRDAIGNIKDNEGIVEIYLKKGASYNLHFIKNCKSATTWVNADKVIMPLLKPITDQYIQWLADARNPTFGKKLLSLGINDDTKNDFAIAINDGKQFIDVSLKDKKIHATSYNDKYEFMGSYDVEIGDDLNTSLNIAFNYLSDFDAKDSKLGLCNFGEFKKLVEENKKRSDLKLISELDDMIAEDSDRGDVAKIIKSKYP